MDDEEIRIGVDTGGTFTDVIMQGSNGSVRVHKLLSTPGDPSRAIGDGVRAVFEKRETMGGEVIHGTTVATNALLERQGGKVAFVTTEGFEDLLWMRRQNRPELYALNIELPSALVDEGVCFGVRERLDAEGEVIEALSDEAVEQVVGEVAAVDPDAVVICLLHSYANREHEERLAAAFRSSGRDWHVTASTEVTATFREYERASTTTVNGYVGPVMGRYLQRLGERLKDVDRLEVLQSHGGRADAGHAARLPVHTVLSGPAGGVVGAVETAKSLSVEQVISFDMGGTSTDVSLADGEATLTDEGQIGGMPLQVPVIDIYTVGAGGGSIAYVDAGGALRVGPRSAGADPGPAAYGRGGSQPTVTDAHVVLGSLRPEQFLGGRMKLDVEAAGAAVDKLGEKLGTSRPETARGILDVADAAMARAIKVISLERGHDPRGYALVAFGGAGGLHACRLAQALEMSTVVVPSFPGLLSAVGMLRSDPRRLYSRTVLRPVRECLDSPGQQEVREVMRPAEERACREMGEPEPELNWTVSLRYQGQSYAISVDVDWGADKTAWTDPSPAFEREHDRLYGYIAEGRPIELVDLRLEARRSGAGWSGAKATEHVSDGEIEGEMMTIDLGAGPTPVEVIARAALSEGAEVPGPAVITEYSGTSIVLDGWSATVESGHLLIQNQGTS